MRYIQCVYTPLFNPGHILIGVAHIQMYEQKNNYQKMYEKSVKKSLERLTAHFGIYGGSASYIPRPKSFFNYMEYQ